MGARARGWGDKGVVGIKVKGQGCSSTHPYIVFLIRISFVTLFVIFGRFLVVFSIFFSYFQLREITEMLFSDRLSKICDFS